MGIEETQGLATEKERFRAALLAITRPEGAYSRDKEQYLENVIAWCIKTAKEALDG
mgnify:CR=1 FL=1